MSRTLVCLGLHLDTGDDNTGVVPQIMVALSELGWPAASGYSRCSPTCAIFQGANLAIHGIIEGSGGGVSEVWTRLSNGLVGGIDILKLGRHTRQGTSVHVCSLRVFET